MEKEYIKLDSNRVQIKKTITTEIFEDYPYEDLVAKRDALIQEKANIIAKMDAEIADLDASIVAADGLQIVANPIDKTVVDIKPVAPPIPGIK